MIFDSYKPFLVYFSSVTENTKIFVEKLPFPSARIPIYTHEEKLVINQQQYILFTPSYGAGRGESSVPPQVRKFLKDKKTRELCIGVIGGGNLNFGEKFAAAADVLSVKLKVPVLYRFELRGTDDDILRVTEGINTQWGKLTKMKGLLQTDE